MTSARFMALMFATLMASACSPAVGSGEEGASAPSPLAAPVELVDGDLLPEVCGQLVWDRRDRVVLLGLIPSTILGIDPDTGVQDEIARSGPGPFEIEGPVVLLSSGASEGQLLAHLPGMMTTLIWESPRGPAGTPYRVRHDRPVSGFAPGPDRSGWWMSPLLELITKREWASARIEIRPARLPSPQLEAIRLDADPAWTAKIQGSPAEVTAAEYFTRLLRASGHRLWRVVLGSSGQVDLVDPIRGKAVRVELPSSDPILVEASTDERGRLHLLSAGDAGSWGHRILVYGSDGVLEELYEGDRDWTVGAVDPAGERWAAVDAETGGLLIYALGGS